MTPPKHNSLQREMQFRTTAISGISFMISYAAVIAAVVTFAWSSQAAQDKLISNNRTEIAVINAKLDTISGKLDELHALLCKINN